MPAVTASAPGKTILFGEHAVVYARPALAVPVFQVRARAQVNPAPQLPNGEVRISAPDVGLEARLNDLPGDHPFSLAIEGVREQLGIARLPAMTIRLTSTIPVAAGLGSSAAVAVALIRVLSMFLGTRLNPADISALAYRVEQRQHGNPSGIDNTVVAYEQPIVFTRGQPFELLNIAQPITLIIADTGVPGRTSETVGAVRARWQADPVPYEAIFDQIAALVRSARLCLENGSTDQLGELMDENQRLLVQLGVSSPELDGLTQAALQAGALGAKLSGGGGGGNMIALVQPEQAEQIAAALQEAGAVRTLITPLNPARPS